jgi:hypothetical protein
MALLSMSMLFMVEERERHQEEIPLISCHDIEILLRTLNGKATPEATSIN